MNGMPTAVCPYINFIVYRVERKSKLRITMYVYYAIDIYRLKGHLFDIIVVAEY
jgi:hypothetical protein